MQLYITVSRRVEGLHCLSLALSTSPSGRTLTKKVNPSECLSSLSPFLRWLLDPGSVYSAIQFSTPRITEVTSTPSTWKEKAGEVTGGCCLAGVCTPDQDQVVSAGILLPGFRVWTNYKGAWEIQLLVEVLLLADLGPH